MFGAAGDLDHRAARPRQADQAGCRARAAGAVVGGTAQLTEGVSAEGVELAARGHGQAVLSAGGDLGHRAARARQADQGGSRVRARGAAVRGTAQLTIEVFAESVEL